MDLRPRDVPEPGELAHLDLPPRFAPTALYDVNEMAHQRFVDGLRSTIGRPGRTYLRAVRRVPDWLAEEEELGCIPGDQYTIAHLARAADHPLELLTEAGLVQRNADEARGAFAQRYGEHPTTARLSEFFTDSLANDPRYYQPAAAAQNPDAANGAWVTMPLRARDADGALRVAGFLFDGARLRHSAPVSGRIVPPVDTQVLSWRNTILGLEEAREELQRNGSLVITRGAYDRLALKASVRVVPDAHRPAVVGLGGLELTRLANRTQTPAERFGELSRIRAQHAVLFLGGDATSRLPLLVADALHASGAAVRIANLADGRGAARRARLSAADDTAAALWREVGSLGVLRALRESLARNPVIYVFERARLQVERARHTERLPAKVVAFGEALDELRHLPGADASALAADLRTTLRLDDAPQIDRPAVLLRPRT